MSTGYDGWLEEIGATAPMVQNAMVLTLQYRGEESRQRAEGDSGVLLGAASRPSPAAQHSCVAWKLLLGVTQMAVDDLHAVLPE